MFHAHVGGMGVELVTRLACEDEILMHPGEICQVFGNIISNALDETEPLLGKLKVRCFPARDEQRNLEGVRFLFSDNGPGIAPIKGRYSTSSFRLCNAADNATGHHFL